MPYYRQVFRLMRHSRRVATTGRIV